MSKLRLSITMSLDGYVAGPDQSLENPLGNGGEKLHDWAFAVRSFRQVHGMDGSDTGPNDQVAAESILARLQPCDSHHSCAMGGEMVGLRIDGAIGTSEHELFVDEAVDLRDIARELRSPERCFTCEQGIVREARLALRFAREVDILVLR